MTVIRMSTEGENTKTITPENNGETKSEDNNEKDIKSEPEKTAENGADKPNNEKINDVKEETDNGKDSKESDKEEEEKDKVKNNSEKNSKVESKDEDEEESENEENGSEKDVPLLDQPLEKSGKRERKNVQRFNDSSDAKESKDGLKVEIPNGSGTPLGNIPRIDASISRFKNDDIKMLHRILFKTLGKSVMIKKNIKKFNGFDFKKNSDEYEKKQMALQKYEVKQLKSVCEMLDLQKNGNKDDIIERIIDFLLEPKDSGKAVAGGRPKRTAAVRANNRGYSSHDNYSSDERHSGRAGRDKGRRSNLKDDSSSQSDEDFHPSDLSDADEIPKVIKRKRNNRKKYVSDDEEDSDELMESESSEEEDEEEDSDEQTKNKRKRIVRTNNKPKGKTTPSKRGRKPGSGNKKSKAAKKRNKDSTDEDDDDDDDDDEEEEEEESDQKEEEEGEESSSEDEPLAKKAKGAQPPTDDEIKSYVKEILEGANLEEITMKTVCQQVYAHYPDFDLAHKKDFIKSTVKSLIST